LRSFACSSKHRYPFFILSMAGEDILKIKFQQSASSLPLERVEPVVEFVSIQRSTSSVVA
jgi:hypothetical protein